MPVHRDFPPAVSNNHTNNRHERRLGLEGAGGRVSMRATVEISQRTFQDGNLSPALRGLGKENLR